MALNYSDDKAEQLYKEYLAGRYLQEYKNGLKPPNDWWCALMGTYILSPDEKGIISCDKCDSKQEAQKIFNEVVSAVEKGASEVRAAEAGKVGELGESITRMNYETDWWPLLRDMLRAARSNWVVVLLVLAAIVGVTAFLVDAYDDTYTKADCIRQWHDQGVFARAEELCAEYP